MAYTEAVAKALDGTREAKIALDKKAHDVEVAEEKLTAERELLKTARATFNTAERGLAEAMREALGADRT